MSKITLRTAETSVTAEQVAVANAATNTCLRAARAGLLLGADGAPARLGSPEFSACVAQAKADLLRGRTPDQILADMHGGAAARPWLTYAIVGAVVIVGAVLIATRKK